MILTVAGHHRHRFKDYPPIRYGKDRFTLLLRQLVANQLEEASPEYLVCGASLGFDMLVTSVAREMHIPYIIAIPYRNYVKAWPDTARMTFIHLVIGASRIVYVARGRPESSKLVRRYRWMIDHADCVLANWDGTKSNTGDIVTYAWSRRKHVKNIWPKFIREAAETTL